MTATLARPKACNLFIVCVTFIVSLAVLLATGAAGLRPAQGTDVSVPAAQPVPVAPAATFVAQPEVAASLRAALPQPVPTAPGATVVEAQHPAETAVSLPATSSPLSLPAMSLAAALLVAAALILRRTGPALRSAAC